MVSVYAERDDPRNLDELQSSSSNLDQLPCSWTNLE